MKNFRITISLLAALLLSVGCFDDPSGEDSDLLGDSSVVVTGDTNESYNIIAFTEIFTYNPGDKKYFSIFLIPENAPEDTLAMTLLFKQGAEAPAAGTYNIGEYAIGQDIPADTLGGGFSSINSDDGSGYLAEEGTLTISEVTSTTISGEFEMTAYYVHFFDKDPDRTVNITGKFQAAIIE